MYPFTIRVQATAFAKVNGAKKYLECSALTGENVRAVMKHAIDMSLNTPLGTKHEDNDQMDESVSKVSFLKIQSRVVRWFPVLKGRGHRSSQSETEMCVYSRERNF